MKHSVSHDLGKEGAKRAALAAFADYQSRFAKYNPTATWTSEDHADVSFTAKGITIQGALDVKPSSIDMEVDIPFLLRPFTDRARGAVEREIGRWVDQVKRGEV